MNDSEKLHKLINLAGAETMIGAMLNIQRMRQALEAALPALKYEVPTAKRLEVAESVRYALDYVSGEIWRKR